MQHCCHTSVPKGTLTRPLETDVPMNSSTQKHDTLASDFEKLIAAGLSRRHFLGGLGMTALGAFFGAGMTNRAQAQNAGPLLGFTPVPASTADAFVVPSGYTARPLISWGDPLFADGPQFDDSARQDAAAQLRQFGDNTDGMSFFPLAEGRALLAVNNEYANLDRLYPHDGSVISAGDALKAQYAHGVSIFEIRATGDGFWQVERNSPLNRRLHARTPMEVHGPAAGHPLLQTGADPSGRAVLGTFGNCANGTTPWGTYLTCEENFQDYFQPGDPATQFTERHTRYQIPSDDLGAQWYRHEARFDLSQEPHEPNRFGWIVEVDPHNPHDVPKKRTALGRFAHENAALVINTDGRIVVYMGDDSRGEHIYRFVSHERYDPQSPAAIASLLDNGTLYAARFSAAPGALQGTGEWLALEHGRNGLTLEAGFADQAEVLIFARLAATAAGATTMDRPEWIAVHPHSGSVFCTLTNNRNRGMRDAQPVDGPNPRAGNHYGQIIRWTPPGGDHTAAGFDWNLFVIAGNPTVHSDSLYAGSANVTPENMFNSPDGLAVDAAGRLWIQTDGDDTNEGIFAGMGNNQMLCADAATGEIRRFATGPLGCELTGTAFGSDSRSLFVGVQHPGQDGRDSHFPGGGSTRPRSTIMVVRKDDGGEIGS